MLKLRMGICLIAMQGLLTAYAIAATAKQPSTVEVGEMGQKTAVSLNAGDTLRVVLEANPTTGYGWQVANNDAKVMRVGVAKSSSMPAGKRMGVGGWQTFTFTAKAAGEDHLVLNYARPWEKHAAPARSYVVEVTVRGSSADRAAVPVVTPAGVLVGTYRGREPCADCSGIQTTIALYASDTTNLTETYYVRTMMYMDAPKGNSTFVAAGTWAVKQEATDTNGAVYSLKSNASDNADSYRLQGDELTPLGIDLKPIQGPFDMDLKKLP